MSDRHRAVERRADVVIAAEFGGCNTNNNKDVPDSCSDRVDAAENFPLSLHT